MLEQAFDSIDNVMRQECISSELDYIEQRSWLLFLKYLDARNVTKRTKPKSRAMATATSWTSLSLGGLGGAENRRRQLDHNQP